MAAMDTATRPVVESGGTDWLAPQPSRPRLLRRHGVQLGLVGLFSMAAGVAIGVAAVNPGSQAQPIVTASAPAPRQPAAPDSTRTTTNPPLTAKAPAAPVVAPARSGQSGVAAASSDKGWFIKSVLVQREPLTNYFTGSARIRNTNHSAKSGSFTVTLFRNGQQIGVLQGVAQDVSAGKTVTVELLSETAYSAGSFSYDFQTDLSG
jgi:hypothetical protein